MSFYWNFMSSLWRRVFLFFSLSFAKHLFAFLFMGWFLGFGFFCACLGMSDFPFFGVFIGCLCISFVVALFETMREEEAFCENCLGKLEDDFVEGDLLESAFKLYYNHFKPLRAKWELKQEKKRRIAVMEEKQIVKSGKERAKRRDFIQEFKQKSRESER